MKTTTKSLPPSLKNLLAKLGFTPRTVEFMINDGAYCLLNTASFSLEGVATEAHTTIDPRSRGTYMGDDGESWYETLTEFHGPVAVKANNHVYIHVPLFGTPLARCRTEEAVLAKMNELEGTKMNTDTLNKAPKGADPTVMVALDGFVEHIEKLCATRMGFEKVGIVFGKKFAKITHGSSVHCFVDLQTGDVLKAASWKAPVVGSPRGTIIGNNPSKYGVSWTGANYLR